MDDGTMAPGQTDPTIAMAADIVSACLAHNRIPVEGLPGLIAATHAALTGLAEPAAPAEPAFEEATPAQIRKSITPEGLASFLDGRTYKTLKRHLGGSGLTPETYRARYGLPKDYPMVAASYSEARSALAKQIGLGNGRRREASEVEAPAAPTAVGTGEKRTRGRRAKKSREAAAAE